MAQDGFLHMRVAAEVIEALDDLRAAERPMPSRSEMVRRLILDAHERGKKSGARKIATCLLVVLASLALLDPVHAQSAKLNADIDVETIKMQKCRNAPGSLIGLSSSQVRAKCGRLSRSNTTTTAAGRSEQVVYGAAFPGGPFLYVYLDDDVVTSVQGR